MSSCEGLGEEEMGMITNPCRASDPNEEMFCNYIELTATKIKLAETTEPCTLTVEFQAYEL